MKPQKGQILTVQRYFNVLPESIVVLAEAGNDNGISFLGKFIVKINEIGIYRFDDGILIKRIK